MDNYKKDLKAYQAKLMTDLLHEIADAPKPDQLWHPKIKFLLSLANARRRKHLTHTELAERTGSHRSAISRVESLKGNPSLKTLLIIAQALDSELVIQSVKLRSDKEGNSTWKRH